MGIWEIGLTLIGEERTVKIELDGKCGYSAQGLESPREEIGFVSLGTGESLGF